MSRYKKALIAAAAAGGAVYAISSVSSNHHVSKTRFIVLLAIVGVEPFTLLTQPLNLSRVLI